MNAALTDNLMEHIGIQKNYVKMIKMQFKTIFGGLMFAIVLITINVVFISSEEIFQASKMVSIITLSYPVIVMYVADLMFVNIIRKVLLMFNIFKILSNKMIYQKM